MNYTEAIQYLAESGKRGSILGLDSVRNLLKYMGDPQQKLQFVHVAGTNGKGSTTAMTASIAACAGYTVGRYTSPAVFDDREKYAVNGEWITECEYAACMTSVAEAARRMEADGLTPPTAFEIETALAMEHFRRRRCDLVVLETGMGGAEDATNIVENTLVCALTAIDMDHMKFLGDTIEEIAAQKAGIIKPGCAVVLEKQSAAVHGVISAACRRMGAELNVTRTEEILTMEHSAAGQRFRYRDIEAEMPLTGRFQLDNAAAAIEVAFALRHKGFDIPDCAIAEGLKKVSWPGRLQQICAQPDVFIDGAHNPNAAIRLAEAMDALWADRKIICIMGVLADKDFTRVAQLVCSRAKCVITVTPESPRALDAASLAEAVSPVCANVHAADSAAAALREAVSIATKDSVVLAFGSLSYLKEITAAAKELR